MVGYICLPYLYALSSYTFSIFTSCYHKRTFLFSVCVCMRTLFHSPLFRVLNSKRFPYFHLFSKHFHSLTQNFEHWGCLACCFDFPLNVHRLCHFCPAHIRATHKIRAHICFVCACVCVFVYLSRKHKPPAYSGIYYGITMFMLFVMARSSFSLIHFLYLSSNIIYATYSQNIFIWLLETFEFVGFFFFFSQKDKSLLCSKTVGYLTYVNGKIASTTSPLHTAIFRALVKFKKIASNNSINITTDNQRSLLMGKYENKMRNEKPPKKRIRWNKM